MQLAHCSWLTKTRIMRGPFRKEGPADTLFDFRIIPADITQAALHCNVNDPQSWAPDIGQVT